MISMGIRVTPTIIYYSILSPKDNDTVEIVFDKLAVPKALPLPGKLRFIRTNIKTIILEYSVSNVGIRTAEPMAQKTDITRIKIEAVIEELISNTFVQNYFSGAITHISASLNITSTELKDKLKNKDLSFLNIPPDIDIPSTNHCEALCVAITAHKCKEGILI